jgi:GDSL-like lipase/acylhydrolase family protein
MKRLRTRPAWSARAVLMGFLIIGGSFLTFEGVSGATQLDAPTYYVALGGSGSVGEQPTALHPSGQPTDDGYSNDLYDELLPTWPGLHLVKLGCPGETTTTFINGLDHCHNGDGSQLADAKAFLTDHPSTVLVTVDLGFNDLRPCLADHVVDQTCVAHSLDLVRAQLASILVSLRAVASSTTQIVGVGHYDPYIGDALHGAYGERFAGESASVVSLLNDALRETYAGAGVRMADVASAFGMGDKQPASMPGIGIVPDDVARVCSLTWACDHPPYGPNQHPDDRGYRAIAEAIRDVMTR